MLKQKKPLRGETLAKTAVNQILNNPQTWNQGSWHSGECVDGCHTVHCVGGWIQVLGGLRENSCTVVRDVQYLLEISSYDANWLCSGIRTISQIYDFVSNFNRTGFNRAGFDRDGFNRAGFNRAGFDRAGFNRAGFNRDGFNRDGKKLQPFVIYETL